jgi:hypothetical protein
MTTLKTKLNNLAANLASILIGIISIFVLIYYFDVPRKLILGWGILSYIIGVAAFKMPFYHFFVVNVLHKKLSNQWLSVSHGLISAISELGAAFLFFVFVVPKLTLVQLIGFGAAAGAVEAIILPFMQNPLKGTPLEDHLSEVIKKSSSNVMIPWMAVLERVIALFTHIATRGLVYISFVSGNIIPAILAVVTFASIDGRGYFAHLEKWPFDNITVLKKIYIYFALIAIIQSILFVTFYFYLL